MATYLVEVYTPRSRAGHAGAGGRRARAAAEALVRQGTAVRYVRSTFVPADETCFHVFEAGSVAGVEEALRRAGIGGARVLLAVEEE